MKVFTISFLLALIALCAVLFVLPNKIRTAVQTTSQEGYAVAATTYPIWVLKKGSKRRIPPPKQETKGNMISGCAAGRNTLKMRQKKGHP